MQRGIGVRANLDTAHCGLMEQFARLKCRYVMDIRPAQRDAELEDSGAKEQNDVEVDESAAP